MKFMNEEAFYEGCRYAKKDGRVINREFFPSSCDTVQIETKTGDIVTMRRWFHAEDFNFDPDQSGDELYMPRRKSLFKKRIEIDERGHPLPKRTHRTRRT